MIILVSGKAQSGKDTFYKIIKEKFGEDYSIVRVAFADQLKKIAKKHFNWNEIKDDNGRRLLVELGTIGRKYDPNLWADKVVKKIMKLPQKTIVIVTDLRYLNELRIIDNAFYSRVVTVRIKRYNYLSNIPIDVELDPSERELDHFDFDYVVPNYDLKQYEESCIGIMQEILNDQ